MYVYSFTWRRLGVGEAGGISSVGLTSPGNHSDARPGGGALEPDGCEALAVLPGSSPALPPELVVARLSRVLDASGNEHEADASPWSSAPRPLDTRTLCAASCHSPARVMRASTSCRMFRAAACIVTHLTGSGSWPGAPSSCSAASVACACCSTSMAACKSTTPDIGLSESTRPMRARTLNQ